MIIAAQALLLILASVAAYAISLGVSRWAMGAGERWGVVSHVSDRSSHTHPTSRLGGAGLAVGFVIPAVFYVGAVYALPGRGGGWGANVQLMAWLLGGALGMYFVGLADDLWDLPPLVKLSGEAASVIPLAAAVLRFMSLDHIAIPGLFPAAVSSLAAVAWVLFFVNAFNFMDGMDGFAARFALHVCLWLFPIAVAKSLTVGDFFDLRLELMMIPILSGACSGFYRVNRSPARVFMGDGGSLFLGYLLALLPILADGGYFTARHTAPSQALGVTGMGVLILMLPFVFDVVLTLIRRARRGENLLAAHRSHLYQRLMLCGMSHDEVLRINVGYFTVCGLMAVGYALVPSFAPARWAAAATAFAAMIHYWRFVLGKERAKKTGG